MNLVIAIKRVSLFVAAMPNASTDHRSSAKLLASAIRMLLDAGHDMFLSLSASSLLTAAELCVLSAKRSSNVK